MNYCNWFYRNNADDHNLRFCRRGSLCPYRHLTQQEVRLLSGGDTHTPCGHCGGTGEMHRFPCVFCYGKGSISEKHRILDRAEYREWCQCETPSKDTHYYPDNTHPKCKKHCYVCTQCKGITQVG